MMSILKKQMIIKPTPPIMQKLLSNMVHHQRKYLNMAKVLFNILNNRQQPSNIIT